VQQANIQGFENLELTTSVTDDINVLWMGPNNNIHKVVYDQGFNFGNSFVPQYLAGLNPGTEIDLLGPAGTSAQGDGDHNLAQNILRVPLNGANIFHTFAETLVLNPVAIETEGVGPDTENAYFGTIDFTAGLAGYSINQLNIDSLNTAEPFEGANDVTNHVNIFDPVAVNAGTLVLGGDQTLDLTGSGLGLFGFSHILADPFTGGLIDTDTIGGVGELDNGTTGITVNLPNAWSSTLNFGNQNDTVTLGNGNNTIQFGDGNDVYTAGNGNNHVSIGYGFEHGGVDNLSFGSGSNLVDLASHDTFANNGSGTAISFAAHTGNDTVAFHSIFNSDFGTPDTISGFQAATDTLSFDHTMLKNNSFNFDLVDVTSDAGAIAAASVDSSTHATFIYNTTTGHLFVDTDANHSITDGAHDMEITLVGIPAITTANIHIA
jgi:hypothetical protein